MRRIWHRLMSRVWIAPVRVMGWMQPVERMCQRRSAMHHHRALGHDLDAMLARLAAKKAGR